MSWITMVLLATSAVALAQTPNSVVVQKDAPSVDGIVAVDEYRLNLSYDNITISLALVGSTLHVGAVAVTSGWVGVGFGSDIMDGARILFSFVEEDGNVFFAEQAGRDHNHQDVSDTLVSAHAVREQGGITTLEAALPAAFVRGTANASGTFPMIFAYGRRDSVRTVHRFFKSIKLRFG